MERTETEKAECAIKVEFSRIMSDEDRQLEYRSRRMEPYKALHWGHVVELKNVLRNTTWNNRIHACRFQPTLYLLLTYLIVFLFYL